MSTTINAGDRVLFDGNWENYGSKYLSFYKENRIYGVVLDEATCKRHHAPSSYTVVSYIDTFPSYKDICSTVMLDMKDLKVIPVERYQESDQWNALAANTVKTEAATISKLVRTTPVQSYMDRKFNFTDRSALDTNHSYAMVGTWNANGTWNNKLSHYRPVCCAFTKMTNDLKVWIPKVWLNYYGYTIYDLVEYLKFLGKCDIGFKYEFLGEEDLDTNFNGAIGNHTGLHERIILGEYSSSVYPLDNKGFVCVMLKGSTQTMETYMRFICLRYIYNMKYWTIPGHALQIKKSLGSLVTHWEALMLAHLANEYYGYYCFVDQRKMDTTKARVIDVNNMHNSSSNFNKFIDPYQSKEETLKKIRTGIYAMNQSFAYTIDAYTREDLNKFFNAQDWIGLYNYTKENRKK